MPNPSGSWRAQPLGYWLLLAFAVFVYANVRNASAQIKHCILESAIKSPICVQFYNFGICIPTRINENTLHIERPIRAQCNFSPIG